MKQRWSRDPAGTVVFIPGYQDNAALWDEVIDRLPDPGWYARAINLRHVDDASPPRRGAILDGYRDQVLDVIHGIDPTAQRPVVVVGRSMGAQVAELVAAARPKHRRRARTDYPGSAGGLPANPRAGNAVRSRSAERPGGLRSGESACTTGQRFSAGGAGAGQRDAATPPVTAIQELDAWTSGHPLETTAHRQRAGLLIGSEDTFSSADLIRVAVAPRFTMSAQSTSPARATGPTSNNPRRWPRSSRVSWQACPGGPTTYPTPTT